MNVDKIMSWGTERMKFTDETPLETGFRHYHGMRVASLAVALAERMGLEVSRDILYIGGFLHDVGKAGYRGPDHGPRGAELIKAEIPHLFSPNELQFVTTIVANHYMRPNSKHFECKDKPHFQTEVLLVQDADTIDHFGSNGIWLAFRWSVQEKRSPQDEIDYYNTGVTKWSKEAMDGLNYDLCRQELQHRTSRMDEFFSYWQKEELGGLTH